MDYQDLAREWFRANVQEGSLDVHGRMAYRVPFDGPAIASLAEAIRAAEARGATWALLAGPAGDDYDLAPAAVTEMLRAEAARIVAAARAKDEGKEREGA